MCAEMKESAAKSVPSERRENSEHSPQKSEESEESSVEGDSDENGRQIEAKSENKWNHSLVNYVFDGEMRRKSENSSRVNGKIAFCYWLTCFALCGKYRQNPGSWSEFTAFSRLNDCIFAFSAFISRNFLFIGPVFACDLSSRVSGAPIAASNGQKLQLQAHRSIEETARNGSRLV